MSVSIVSTRCTQQKHNTTTHSSSQTIECLKYCINTLHTAKTQHYNTLHEPNYRVWPEDASASGELNYSCPCTNIRQAFIIGGTAEATQNGSANIPTGLGWKFITDPIYHRLDRAFQHDLQVIYLQVLHRPFHGICVNKICSLIVGVYCSVTSAQHVIIPCELRQ